MARRADALLEGSLEEFDEDSMHREYEALLALYASVDEVN